MFAINIMNRMTLKEYVISLRDYDCESIIFGYIAIRKVIADEIVSNIRRFLSELMRGVV